MFFFFYGLKLNSQNNISEGKIIYKVSHNKVNLDTTKFTTDEAKKTILKFVKEASDIKANLYFKGQIGVYEVEKKLHNDSEPSINLTRISAGGKNTYYTDLSKKEHIVQTSSTGRMYLIHHPEKKWIITKEEKQIGDYKCYKAYLKEGKTTSTAWFTLDIPINHGPLGYNGLPGLILELTMPNANFVISEISFTKIDNSKIMKPTKGEKISYQKYYDTYKF